MILQSCWDSWSWKCNLEHQITFDHIGMLGRLLSEIIDQKNSWLESHTSGCHNLPSFWKLQKFLLFCEKFYTTYLILPKTLDFLVSPLSSILWPLHLFLISAYLWYLRDDCLWLVLVYSKLKGLELILPVDVFKKSRLLLVNRIA